MAGKLFSRFTTDFRPDRDEPSGGGQAECLALKNILTQLVQTELRRIQGEVLQNGTLILRTRFSIALIIS